jgi:hypothetical protein
MRTKATPLSAVCVDGYLAVHDNAGFGHISMFSRGPAANVGGVYPYEHQDQGGREHCSVLMALSGIGV